MQLMQRADAFSWTMNWKKDGCRVVTVFVKRDRPFESEARLLYVMRKKKEKWVFADCMRDFLNVSEILN